MGDLPDPGIKPISLAPLALAGGFLTTALPGKLYVCVCVCVCMWERERERVIMRNIIMEVSKSKTCHLQTGNPGKLEAWFNLSSKIWEPGKPMVSISIQGQKTKISAQTGREQILPSFTFWRKGRPSVDGMMPTTLGRATSFTQSNSNTNLIWKHLHRHPLPTQIMFI